MIDMNVIVLSATQYRITSDEGKSVEGTSCVYLMKDSLAPVVNSETSLGIIPVKCTFPHDFFSRFQSVPGVYKFSCEFSVTGGVGGKASLRPVTVDFVAPLVDVKSK